MFDRSEVRETGYERYPCKWTRMWTWGSFFSASVDVDEEGSERRMGVQTSGQLWELVWNPAVGDEVVGECLERS